MTEYCSGELVVANVCTLRQCNFCGRQAVWRCLASILFGAFFFWHSRLAIFAAHIFSCVRERPYTYVWSTLDWKWWTTGDGRESVAYAI